MMHYTPQNRQIPSHKLRLEEELIKLPVLKSLEKQNGVRQNTEAEKARTKMFISAVPSSLPYILFLQCLNFFCFMICGKII